MTFDRHALAASVSSDRSDVTSAGRIPPFTTTIMTVGISPLCYNCSCEFLNWLRTGNNSCDKFCVIAAIARLE